MHKHTKNAERRAGVEDSSVRQRAPGILSLCALGGESPSFAILAMTIMVYAGVVK